MSPKTLSLTLKIWRQENASKPGRLVTYNMRDISPDMSFLEMLDTLNETLTREGNAPVAFDHDCREGICGSCGAMVNGRAHGPLSKTTLCQVHMRSFKDGDTLVIEPFRAKAMPIVKDLVIDRTAMDRIITSGGYVSVKTGSAPEANTIPVSKPDSDLAFDAAECIGCAACVAACPNASASLFVAAKVSHLALLPQGQVERKERVTKMVWQMDSEGFGNCSNAYQCEAACPKGIQVENIARMNRERFKASLS